MRRGPESREDSLMQDDVYEVMELFEPYTTDQLADRL